MLVPPQKPCRLCGKNEPLCESHIFPRFYWAWMKETGGSGYLRSLANPNQRQQDGDKRYLLCGECEERFSALETAAARDVFRPLVQDPTVTVNYDDDFFRFVVSVLWRNIAINLDDGTPAIAPSLNEVQLVWRRYLLGEAPLKGFNQLHMFIVPGTPLPPAPPVSMYLNRIADYCVATQNGDPIAIYAKFANLIFWLELKQSVGTTWVGTSVSEGAGTFRSGGQQIEGPFTNFLFERAEMCAAAHQRASAGMSAQQKAKIEALGKVNKERLDKSHLRKMLAFDARMATSWNAPTPSVLPKRNERCFCGSGAKYKKCHGAPWKSIR